MTASGRSFNANQSEKAQAHLEMNKITESAGYVEISRRLFLLEMTFLYFCN